MTRHTHQSIMALVDQRAEDECWPWLGSLVPGKPYGQVRFEGKKRKAHRAVFFIVYGYWPSVVRHSCDNPVCCNPRHLLAGSTQDNVNDRVARKRSATGERNGRAKLSDEQVKAIRADRRRLSEIAQTYGVHHNTIYRVRKGGAR